MRRRIKLGHRKCNTGNREAYFIAAGSGSATDGVTPAARLKMATRVEARISNVVNVVKI